MFSRTKIISAIAAATALGGATVATTSPAQAWCGYYGCGYGYGDAALAAGIVGGLAVGAIAANAAAQNAQARRSTRARGAAAPRRARVARAAQ